MKILQVISRPTSSKTSTSDTMEDVYWDVYYRKEAGLYKRKLIADGARNIIVLKYKLLQVRCYPYIQCTSKQVNITIQRSPVHIEQSRRRLDCSIIDVSCLRVKIQSQKSPTFHFTIRQNISPIILSFPGPL